MTTVIYTSGIHLHESDYSSCPSSMIKQALIHAVDYNSLRECGYFQFLKNHGILHKHMEDNTVKFKAIAQNAIATKKIHLINVYRQSLN